MRPNKQKSLRQLRARRQLKADFERAMDALSSEAAEQLMRQLDECGARGNRSTSDQCPRWETTPSSSEE